MSESSSARGVNESPDVSEHSAQRLSGLGQSDLGQSGQGQTGQDQSGPPPRDDSSRWNQLIEGHLGSAGPGLELVGATYPAWRWVDVDAALDGLDEDQTLRGVGPGVSSVAELLTSSTDGHRNDPDDYRLRPGDDRVGPVEHRVRPGEQRLRPGDHRPGPVQRSAFPVGPDEVRCVATNALRLVWTDGGPVVVFAIGTPGEQGARVEVLAADSEAARSVLAAIDDAVWADSSLRGRVVSFRTAAFVPSSPPNSPSFSHLSPVIDFHERHRLIANDVVLPAGRLTRVESVVLGMSRNAAWLRAAGQHVPRGVLLYGPPGSGKTHTVRYLLSQSPETTAFILPGTLLGSMRAGDMNEDGPADLIRQVLATARQLTPAIVVLEDVDLLDVGHVADDADRPGLTQDLAALSELHDDEDSDVAVILTTSHVESLEQALARCPGVIDLSLEVPLPDVDLRERLFARSARAVPVTSAGVRTAAEAALATPGSFPRQAVRRAVLDALSAGTEVDDASLVSAVRALMAEREELRTATSKTDPRGRRSSVERVVGGGPVAAGLGAAESRAAETDSARPNAAGPEIHGSSEHSDGPWAEGSVPEVRGAGDVLAVLRAREGRRDSFGTEGAFSGGRHGDGPGSGGGLESEHLDGGHHAGTSGYGGPGASLGGGVGFDGDDGLGEGDGLDGGDGLDREDLDVEVIDDLDDGLSGEDLLDLDLDDED